MRIIVRGIINEYEANIRGAIKRKQSSRKSKVLRKSSVLSSAHLVEGNGARMHIQRGLRRVT